MPHAASTAANFIDGFGDLASMADMIGPMVMLASGLVDYVVLQAWWSGYFGPEFLVWFGNLMALIISLIAAAYVAVSTVKASVSFVDGFAFTYRNDTILGSMVGLWECVFVLMYLMWSMVVIVAAFLMAYWVTDIL
jgi:hypothetical protein